MFGLEREALLQLFFGELELVLILVDAGAVVVDHGGIGGVQAERAIELVEGLLIHAVHAERDAGDHVDVPVVGGGAEKVLDAVAGALFFSAR